jgi:tetratricopeptide (TPR) repeat protein
MLRWTLGWFSVLTLSGGACFAGEVRTWTDKSGKHQIEAELLAVSGGHATLRKVDGKTLRVAIDRLSEADRRLLESATPGNRKARGNAGNAPAAENAADAPTTTFRDLDTLARSQREATFVVNLFEAFLETSGVSEADKEKARKELPEWRVLAAKQALRVGSKWLAPAEYKQAKEAEIRLIKEAHRLIDVKNDELAEDKLLEASKVNPEAVRADFYLGLLYTLVAHKPHDAERYFRECVKRLQRDEDLSGARRANFVAALNNLALVQVRKRQYKTAISLWRRALEVAPFTPELVQNLGLMSELAQTARFVRIPQAQRNSAGELYAKATVENSLARFDENVGWLYIPYVDTVDGTMDGEGDEELVTVAWCTGFSIGGEYLLTSRYPVEDADRIVAREGGSTFNADAGKVVALSDDSHLVVVRIDGLNGKQLPLNLVSPRPATDVTIIGYGSPGLMTETLQRREATILNPPRFYENVQLVVRQRLSSDVELFVHTGGLRQLLMHDAITNPAMEGAPLIDKKGAVVGVHLGNRPQFGRLGAKQSFAESGAYVMDRITSVTSDVNFRSSSSDNGPPLDDAAVDSLVNGSIYQLAVQRRAPRLAWSHRIEELHRLQKQGSWVSYEDKTCMACNGRLRLECPARGCVRGFVKHRERELKRSDPNTGAQLWGYREFKKRCTTCDGEGTVQCPNCNGEGIDQMLN